MPEYRLTFFVSATSKELGSCRRAIIEILQSRGIFADVQDITFVPDYHQLMDLLRRKIIKSDGVICLVGDAFGAAAPCADDGLRSYTQLEYEVARKLEKPVYVFLTTEGFQPDEPVEQTDEMREQQLAHRRRIQASGCKWEEFSSVDELKLKIATLAIPGSRQTENMPCRIVHPPAAPAYFAGRDIELDQLCTALEGGSNCVVVVVGPGGQGKTTLVREWWRKHREPDDVIGHFAAGFWCSPYVGGYTFDAFLDDLLEYLTQGEFDKRACPETNTRIRMALRQLQERSCLVVIDGIERWLRGWNVGSARNDGATEAEQRKGHFPGVDEFLTQAAGIENRTRLVLPTRALPAVLDHVACTLVPVYEQDRRRIVTLQGLSRAAAVNLLEQVGVQGTPGELTALADKYDRHPLALNVLGRLLVHAYGGRIVESSRPLVLDPKDRLFELFKITREHLPGRDRAERFLHVASLCLDNACLPVLAAGLDEAAPTAPGHPGLAAGRWPLCSMTGSWSSGTARHKSCGCTL